MLTTKVWVMVETRISFDFERNGWKVERLCVNENTGIDVWEEVGFSPSRNLEQEVNK